MTESIPIGPATTLTQNVVYAMPPVSCIIQTTGAMESSLEVGGTFTAFSTAIVIGAFVRCPGGGSIVILRRDTVVP